MIRQATYDDLPALTLMGEAMLQETVYRVIQFDARRAMDFTAQLIEMENGYVGVYEQDGELCGAMLGAAQPAWFGDGVDQLAHDLFLYVRPASRHSRVAPALIEDFKQWACSQPNVRQVRVATSAGGAGQGANVLFERAGFEPVGKVFCLEVQAP
jgi:GNAT superfamily N-acetyltransferase